MSPATWALWPLQVPVQVGDDVSVASQPGGGPRHRPSSCLHCVHAFSQPRSWFRMCETTQVALVTAVSGKTKGVQKE